MARYRRSAGALGFAATALFGSACAVGPDFVRPAAPDVDGSTSLPLAQQTASSDVAGREAQRFVRGLDIPGQWRRLFHSVALNSLIEEALNNNPTLPAAEAALRQARENVYAAQGAFFPDRRGRLLAEPQEDRDRRSLSGPRPRETRSTAFTADRSRLPRDERLIFAVQIQSGLERDRM